MRNGSAGFRRRFPVRGCVSGVRVEVDCRETAVRRFPRKAWRSVMATEADRNGDAGARRAATILPFGGNETPVQIILDQDSRTEAGRRDAALSACDWRPDDLRQAVAGAQLTAEDQDGLRRFGFDDGSAIAVCGARYREYHVGFHRSDCENRTLLEALARLSGKTAEFARKTARFACPTTLEAANPEVVFIDPPALVASMDLASQQAAGGRGRQPAIKLAFDTSLSTSASELDEVLSAVERGEACRSASAIGAA